MYCMAAKKKNGWPGPCPDPDRYILVQTKEGAFWRRKRGTLKPARLNTSFRKNVINSKVAGPAAKRVIRQLQPFLRVLQPGRLQAQLAGAFIKSLNENGRIDYSFLQDLELNRHPLAKLLNDFYFANPNDSSIKICIPVNSKSMNRLNQAVTDYYFEAILLYGDPSQENRLQIYSTISRLYSFINHIKTKCVFTLQLPPNNIPWMVLLKASCQRPNQPSNNPRAYGMKVVAVGGGIF